jgi:cephalosporin hydroxylase
MHYLFNPRLWLKAFLKHRRLIFHLRSVFPQITRNDLLRGLGDINIIQRKIIGRYCGDLGDKIAQYFSIVQYARAQNVSEMDSIEIGTLFGGSCLSQLSAMRNLNVKGKVVCIDPMAGYYDQKTDPKTGIEVNPEVFYHNLEIFSFSKASVELRQFKSDMEGAYNNLAEGQFATLIIDGDHSYDGVMHDWDCYNRFIAKGGFVLFDDYDEPYWPDVTTAVDQIANNLSEQWHPCGKLGTTFIFQRVD